MGTHQNTTKHECMIEMKIRTLLTCKGPNSKFVHIKMLLSLNKDNIPKKQKKV